MAKRRTKKQKQTAKHPFAIHWEPNSTKSGSEAKTNVSKALVKGQTKKVKPERGFKTASTKYAGYTEEYENLASIKLNLVKSLIISSLILSLEVVLYFIWH